MEWRLLGIACCALFVLWIHRGPYPRAHICPAPSRRELLEVLLIIAGLLTVPYLRMSLLWYDNWLGPYLMLGIWAPFVCEMLLRGRDLTLMGVARPMNGLTLRVVGTVLALYLVSKVVDPLHVSAGPYAELSWSWSAILVFPLVEEILFRGLLQTRLEALLGSVRAWLGSGVLFGGYHYYVNFFVTGRVPHADDLLSLAYLVVFGMLLGVIAAKTRSLLPSFLVHALNNLTL
ncbi:MAG: CPBP family intramembrane glutamic endopeptidase [Anaerolineae bacterium]